jgi:cyanophycinase
MAGYRVLAGGAEFTAAMAAADRRALELAGGRAAAVRIIPAAAAADHNHQRAGARGTAWFRSLGAVDVAVVPLIDRRSAADAAVVDQLAAAQLIYLLGGFPGYLLAALQGTPAWRAVDQAYLGGAVLAGSSAGAMVLGRMMLEPTTLQLQPGLDAVACCVVPHLDDFGAPWLRQLAAQQPELPLLGIAAGSALIDDGPDGQWRQYGRGPLAIASAGTISWPAADLPIRLP